jgi:ABC-type transport system involved in multi-copper enzyme maturation permease subunit
MRKGHPFLEIFSSAVKENYRFPILEIFAFSYAFGTFVFAGVGTISPEVTQLFAHTMVSSLSGLPMFIFVILILVNVAYGLGNDIEKGVIQTLLSYPLKRRSVLSAKLLSALGIALILFMSLQLFAFYVLAPEVMTKYFGTVLLTYLAVLSVAFQVAGVVLLIALAIRRGGLALVFGIVLYFAVGIMISLVSFLTYTGSDLALRVFGVISPNMILDRYYSSGSPSPYGTTPWVPSFSQVLLYVGAAYGIAVVLFIIGYVYFDRRLGI